MVLTDRDKQFIDTEFQKLVAVINYITELTGAEKETDETARRFIVTAGIEIYKKM